MTLTLQDFLTIDLPAVLIAVLAGMSCGLLGNFLVLRRQALIGDAIAHVVLPGIVVGFIATQSMAAPPMMLSAMAAALIAAGLIEVIRRLGHLESGAAMGVVFTTMFAGGVVLLEAVFAGNVHLNADHALYGNLEGTLWIGADGWSSLTDPAALAALPRPLVTLAVVTSAIAIVVVVFFKELRISTFDPGLATSLGYSATGISIGLIVMVAMAAVAAFEAVGSILVIAMFICPAATARMLTDRLSTQIWISVAAAMAAGILGYVAAAFGPFWIGGENSLNAAGMIAVAAGVLQGCAMLFAPKHGTVWRRRAGVTSESVATL